MKITGNPKQDEATRRLLEEGTRSYLDAMNALIAYRQEVQKTCRTVLETYVDDYASALKVSLKSSEIRDAESPPFTAWKGDHWALGVKIVREKITPTIRWWETWCHLHNEAGDNGLCCCIDEWYPSKQLAAAVHRKFHALNKKVVHSGKDVFLYHSFPVEEICNLQAHLEAILQQWIGLWTEVGGIKNIAEV